MIRTVMTKILSLLFILTFSSTLPAQTKILQGNIKDAHSDEPIPFASIKLRHSGIGKLSDSAGHFILHFPEWPKDTIEITYVGYEDFIVPLDSLLSRQGSDKALNLSILLIRGKYANEVTVKQKIDRGYLMWKRIVKKKAKNDRYRYENFSYQLYNKLEVDLKNFKKDKLEKFPIIRDYGFVFNNMDTTEEGKPFLPVYLTEALSHYYYQKDPKKRREVFIGTKTTGVTNESVLQFLGGMDQNINVYSNFVPIFDKQFISPLSDNGDLYYKYKVLDSQFVSNRRLIHMMFSPKRPGENTFEGDCWVHDTTWAVQKINLRLTTDANINFVDKLSLIQEFKQVNDSSWFLNRDKFVVDLSLTGDKNLSVIGRKTTLYDHISINDSKITRELAKNQLMEETVIPESAKFSPDSFWVAARPEALNKNETAIYHTIDTLLSLPSFQKTANLVNFITTGYANMGKYQIGPWQNWIYSSVLEGLRLRWDLNTNEKFSKNLQLHGYAAYGFGDKAFKGKLEGRYLFSRQPRTAIFASYGKDFDRAQTYYDEISQDNIFALAIRKNNIPIKFMMLEEGKLSYFKEWHNGFSFQIGGARKIYTPVQNLPGKELFANAAHQALNSFETSLQLRFAYLEKFISSNFYRTSLGSPYPITEIKFTRGMKGVLNSSYDYSKLSGSISDYATIAPLGSIYYNVFAGKTFGTLPYMFLDVAPGNEIYYYNRYAFNLMNRFEYLHDNYVGLNFEHNIGNGVFRFIPITRKLKFRQFWNIKMLRGSLSDANYQLNMPANAEYKFSTLNGQTYTEIGTGVDNIFKLFRLDFVWRLGPKNANLESVKKFGMFFSFRLAF